MRLMSDTITHFLQQQSCATICCINEGVPYCFSCYYAFNPEDGLLYFKSSEKAGHFALLTSKAVVAGTIHPDKINKMVTRGILFQGEILDRFDPMAKDADAIYHRNIPMALVIKGTVFTVLLNMVKMTDSRMGFGKKIAWDREAIEDRMVPKQ